MPASSPYALFRAADLDWPPLPRPMAVRPDLPLSPGEALRGTVTRRYNDGSRPQGS